MRKYYEECRELLNSFSSVIMNHIPRNQNLEVNRLAQSASIYRQIVKILADEVVADKDWRKDIIEYLKMISYIREQLMVCSLSISTKKLRV